MLFPKIKILKDFFKSFIKINIKTVNFVFIAGAIAGAASYILFSIGLNHDGAPILFSMILWDSYSFWEESRKIFHILYQFPAWLFIKLSPFKSISPLVKVFSFGLIWIHLISLIGCWFVLPKDKKHFVFFPLFGFFAGPILALGISISVALSVCSWVWMTAFIIHYSDLSKTAHKILFLAVPLPFLLSHEMMSYAAWPLIGLCLYKYKKEEQSRILNKALIGFSSIWLLASSALQTFLLFKRSESDHYISFKEAFFNFDFLYIAGSDYKINSPLFVVCLAFFVLTAPLLHKAFFQRRGKKLLKIASWIISLSLISISLAIPLFNLTGFFINYFNLRVIPPTIGLFLSLLIWALYEFGKAQTSLIKIEKLSCASLIFCCLALVFFRVESDFIHHKYTTKFTEQLSKCEGILNPESVRSLLQVEDAAFSYFTAHKAFANSLLYPKKRYIRSVLAPSFDECNMSLCQRQDKSKFQNSRSSNLEDSNSSGINCYRACLNRQMEDLQSLSKTGFFDFSELQKSIQNNVSRCEND